MGNILNLDTKPNAFIEELNSKEDNPKKYVRVIGDFYLVADSKTDTMQGIIRPIILVHTSGRQYEIEHATMPIKCAALKSGGAGIRYTCTIRGALFYLYLENNMWYYERVGD